MTKIYTFSTSEGQISGEQAYTNLVAAKLRKDELQHDFDRSGSRLIVYIVESTLNIEIEQNTDSIFSLVEQERFKKSSDNSLDNFENSDKYYY